MEGDIRQSDGLAFATVDQILHGRPGFEQSHAPVVQNFAVSTLWILLFPRLKSKRSVNKIKVQIVEPESIAAGLKSRFDALGPMIRVPQLRSHEDVFTRNFLGEKPLPRSRELTLL